MKDTTTIRRLAQEIDVPIVEAVLRSLRRLSRRSGTNFTLLAVCPNSQAVLRAALVAADRARAPVMFAVTLNQVDLDGGYTGWTQGRFVTCALRIAGEVECRSPIMIGLDHGGPWLKDRHMLESWDLGRTMAATKQSLTSCLLAGYDLLHIDCTVDPFLKASGEVTVDAAVERTLELIEHAEAARLRSGLPRVSYEVGSEEPGGGLTDPDKFRAFLKRLRFGLARRGLGLLWPCFVVGSVGTDLGKPEFSPEVAETLSKIATKYGSAMKGHYTDYVTDPRSYPKSGMGGANVGPEFTDAEYGALMDLVKHEQQASSNLKISEMSNLEQVLRTAVIESGRWKKWRRCEEVNQPFDELSAKRQNWLIRTGCRYVWTAAPVVKARERLYENLLATGIDGEKAVTEKIVKVMMKYFKAFNLIDSRLKIEAELEVVSKKGWSS